MGTSTINATTFRGGMMTVIGRFKNKQDKGDYYSDTGRRVSSRETYSGKSTLETSFYEGASLPRPSERTDVISRGSFKLYRGETPEQARYRMLSEVSQLKFSRISASTRWKSQMQKNEFHQERNNHVSSQIKYTNMSSHIISLYSCAHVVAYEIIVRENTAIYTIIGTPCTSSYMTYIQGSKPTPHYQIRQTKAMNLDSNNKRNTQGVHYRLERFKDGRRISLMNRNY